MAVVHATDSDFDQIVLQSKKPVLVDFWAAWCGPCRMLAPVIEALDAAHSDKMTFVKVDSDNSPNKAQAYDITGIPCCLLFKEGKEVVRLVGYRSKEQFENDLRAYVAL